jgi:beta-glucosidase/6-phospho-beta-glucosidase/beta-galactosidase
MVAEAYRCGLEPVVTLHHFVHPAWLGWDPWLSSTTTALFATYAVETVQHVNRRLIGHHGARPIRFFITINEPNMLVLNTYVSRQFPSRSGRGFDDVWRAASELFRAHIEGYNAIHDLYREQGWPRPWITTNNYCTDLYWSDKLWLDLLDLRRKSVRPATVEDYVRDKAREFQRSCEEACLLLRKDLPYFVGNALRRFVDRLGSRHFDAGKVQPLLDTVYRSSRHQLSDYVALDYYDPFVAHIFRRPVWWDHEFRNKSLRTWIMNSVTSKWWDWRILPAGLHFFCETYHREYQRPVLIAENGMAQRRRRGQPAAHRRRDRITRSEFLRLHIREVKRIREQGIPLFGYLHWSLFDNYEWGTYTPRFGLFSLDYDRGTDRLPVNVDGDEPSRTYAELVAESNGVRPA